MSDDEIVQRALSVLESRMRYGDVLSSPEVVRSFLRLKLAELEHEVFGVVYLTSQNAYIHHEELFRGTLCQTSVYPREVVKEALKHNAAGILLFHNHPSGVAQPSHADENLTRALKQALALVDVKVLDHLLVGGSKITSFAEVGLL